MQPQGPLWSHPSPAVSQPDILKVLTIPWEAMSLPYTFFFSVPEPAQGAF
jgi:hypothetical protein